MITYLFRFMLLMLLLSGAACGGGGEAGTASSGKVVAIMKAAALSPAATTVGAISVTISIPYGVSAKTDAGGNVVVAEVVQLLNTTLPLGTLIQVPTYVPATATQTGTIQFTILNADGFNVTEEVVINLVVQNGFFPKATDFSLVNFVAKDLNGADITTLNPTLSATVQ